MPLKHILVAYHTPMGRTCCSAVIGRILQGTAVLLVERDENRLTSITNAMETVTDEVTKLIRRGFEVPAEELHLQDLRPITYAADILWFEAYEYRISMDGLYPDPAVMQIDVDNETWTPIDAVMLEQLLPFFAAFRQPPVDMVSP